ncbi:MAG: ATP-binding cassette domain-containing protein [Candidatus Heimdallarchaeota archaeon]|nr:ATP-binding cassette domain-containing protein [Candidatus Heimdallarchaeota archaeon]
MSTIETIPDDILMRSSGVYSIYKGKEGAANVVALKGVNLEIKRGEFVAVVGPSGSGKSTLMRCLGGLQHPSAGIINYENQDITKLNELELVPFRRQTVGFVFQEGNLMNTISAYQNVVRTLRYSGVGYTESRKRASNTLEILGLKSRMHDLPHRLSGGERQRVAIARAIAPNPKIILADEPTGSLDYKNTENVMNLFRDLHNDLDMSFLVVTHSQHVSSFADRNLELRDGKFTGQHQSDFDVYNLEQTRNVIINEDGSLVLPPEMLGLIETYGKLWEFSLQIDNGNASILAKPTKDDLTHCPVCKKPITSDDFHCNSCGAKLRG